MPKQTKRKPPPAHPATTKVAAAPLRVPAVPSWCGPALIAVAGLVMLVWSWGTWPDVMVDFGREIYIPWRIVDGDVLYRDLAYFNGPLSPYVNTVWFALFGSSLRVLALANLAILGAITVFAYRLMVELGGRVSALLGGMALMLVFGFSRYIIAGNFNFITPYSHEMTHGLLLSFVALWCVSRYVRTGGLRDVALCGLCVGLALLTKPEIVIALVPAASLGVTLAWYTHAGQVAKAVPTAGTFIGTAALPPLLAFLLLALAMSPSEAYAGVLGGFQWLLSSTITNLPFYRQSMGLLNPDWHLGYLFVTTFWYAIILGFPIGLGFIGWRSRQAQVLAAAACFLVVAVGLGVNLATISEFNIFRPAPIVLSGALVGLTVLWFRDRSAASRARLVLPTAFLVFALLLMAKILLHARVLHYGFALAMPAALLTIVILWDWLPRLVEFAEGSSWMLRGAFLAALLMMVVKCLTVTHSRFATLTVPVGSGADAFLADSRGAPVNRVLEDLSNKAAADATLAVVPEGVLLNYLTRRVNPTPYVTLMPVEMLMFGEDHVLAALQSHPPDFLIVSDRDTREYGSNYFGSGYAEEIFKWLMVHYKVVGRPPAPPPPPSSTEPIVLQAVLMQHVAGAVDDATSAGPPAAAASAAPENSDINTTSSSEKPGN